ncbi:MAG: hypothetical protein K1X94_23995 [Sandaracinaceae bacterium]|nr:hypothetical protein [Sandaracinaceae bacterium]
MTQLSASSRFHRAHVAVCLVLGLTVAGCPSSTPADAGESDTDPVLLDAGPADAAEPPGDVIYGLMDAPSPVMEDAPRPSGRFDCEGGYCEEGEVGFVLVGTAPIDAAVGPDAGPTDDASTPDAGRPHAAECRAIPAECPPLEDCFGSRCDVWRGCFHAPCTDVLISDFGRRFQCAS